MDAFNDIAIPLFSDIQECYEVTLQMNAAQNGVKESNSVDIWEVRAPEKGQLYFITCHYLLFLMLFQTLISLLSF